MQMMRGFILFRAALLGGMLTSCGPSSSPAPPADASVNDAGSDAGSDAAACLPKGASCAVEGGYDPGLCCSGTCGTSGCK